MKNSESANPYTAGWGLWPPHFAGRRHEVQAIVNALAKIKDGSGRMDRSPDPALVLVGPRGVGKTVLLERALVEAGKHGIHTAEINSDLLSGPQKILVRRVFQHGFIKKFIGMLKGVTVGITNIFVSADLRESKGFFDEAMSAFLSKKPLLLVLDEAHTFDQEALKMLFGAAQSCMKSRMPLALIIAGTPGLEPLMQRCNATYVERSEFLRINTLSHDEAKEALEIPAREAGRPMEPDALKLLLDWANNYPFFVQLAGRRTWDVSSQRGGGDMTVADAQAGLAKANMDREVFYSKRHTELKKRHIADHAMQVIDIIRDLGGKAKNTALENRLMEMNEGMDNDRAIEVLEELQEVGFVWQSGEGIEPSIPSMFDYIIREHEVA